jgi:hypothetical protein
MLTVVNPHGMLKLTGNSETNLWYNMIYLSAIGLTPGGSSTVHIYTHTHTQYIEQHNRHKQNIEQNNSLIRKSAGRDPSLRGIPWYMPYKWGKNTEKPQSGSAGEWCHLSFFCVKEKQFENTFLSSASQYSKDFCFLSRFLGFSLLSVW